LNLSKGVTQVHSGREYISVLENYSKVVGGPTQSQIAKSLGLSVNSREPVEFLIQPKSRTGNNQVIGGMVVSVKIIDRNGPCWMIVINEISIKGTSNIVRERELKIYYHASGEGIIMNS